MEQYGGSACDAAVYAGNKSIPIIPSNKTCSEPPDSNVFFEGFLTAVSTVPSNILAILVMDKIGAKIILGKLMCPLVPFYPLGYGKG
jgi:hypothetical protein